MIEITIPFTSINFIAKENAYVMEKNVKPLSLLPTSRIPLFPRGYL